METALRTAHGQGQRVFQENGAEGFKLTIPESDLRNVYPINLDLAFGSLEDTEQREQE